MIVDHDDEETIQRNNRETGEDEDEELSDSLSDHSEELSGIRIEHAPDSFKYRYKLLRFLAVFCIVLMIGIGAVQMMHVKKVTTTNHSTC